MNNLVTGLHHLTAIATDPQANVDFYAGLLGLRLVKKTVNFDDPSAYHLYYGDAAGTPGSIVTFFYWPGAPLGRIGRGQATRIVLSAAPAALPFWEQRLAAAGVAFRASVRFGESVITLADPDGIPVELVAVDGDLRTGWDQAGIPAEFALRGLHTAELTVREAGPTEQLLTGPMGYTLVRRDGPRARFAAGPGGSGRYVDVIAAPDAPAGSGAAGTIHHIAFRVADDTAELEMRTRLQAAGLRVSPVMDRSYFRSIYYRESGGILFEIATDVPGFDVDEPRASLGSTLRLPRQFEALRREIETRLPPLAAPRTPRATA